MKLRCVLLILAIGIPAAHYCSSTCDAQWRPLNQTGQKPLRLLGHGWSAGYHWRNPGHDPSYYNPYSHHNSHLRSQWSYDSNYSGVFAHSSQSIIDNQSVPSNVPVIDGEFRTQTPNQEGQSAKKNEPPSSENEVQRQPPQKASKPAAGGKEKSELEKELPFEFE